MKKIHSLILLAIAMYGVNASAAPDFSTEDFTVNVDSTVSLGTGIRTSGPSCSVISAGATGPGAPTGCLSPSSALGDQGNLNYAKGEPFTTFLKGTHEVIIKMPSEDITFMGRFEWIKDFSATDTTGIAGVTDPGPPAVVGGLSEPARSALNFQGRLLDLWVSKSFDIGDERARIRVGNQVISWGESLFLPGGINSTNAVDLMRLAQPGTQIKEAILAAPMISFASGLGYGFNIEAYVQTGWNADYFPPTGSYWSTANGLGKGDTAYGLVTTEARNSGQWGLSLRYQPEEMHLNLGLYVMSYNDKAPEFSTSINNSSVAGWVFPEQRKLFGVSANLPVGDWAIGSELSYRPRDAVPLNSAVDGCASQGGNCWVDTQKYQAALTGLYSATPSNAKALLDALKADTATLMIEAVGIYYPQLKQTYGKDPISSGGWGWGQEYSPNGTPIPMGTKMSYGYNFDFSWVYDGTLLPGWQVVPELFFFDALKGRTPNASGTFMQGAKSANFIVTLIQNPASWQLAVNYTKFWGGDTVFDQPYIDRNFAGITLSRNF